MQTNKCDMRVAQTITQLQFAQSNFSWLMMLSANIVCDASQQIIISLIAMPFFCENFNAKMHKGWWDSSMASRVTFPEQKGKKKQQG